MGLTEEGIIKAVEIASNPDTPEEELRKLSKHPQMEVREAVALNIKAPLNLLEELLEDDVLDVRVATLKNKNLSHDIYRTHLDEQILHMNDGIYSLKTIFALSINPLAKEEDLKTLAKWIVLGLLNFDNIHIADPLTHVDLLMPLDSLLYKILNQEAFSLNSIKWLVKEFGEKVYYHVAISAKTSASVLFEIATNSPDYFTEKNLLEHQNSSQEVFEVLEKSNNLDIANKAKEILETRF